MGDDIHHNENYSHPPVLYESLSLLVKFAKAPRVTIVEGQCLWALRQFLPQVPVPEIYGCRQEGSYTYLYMELVQGVTLEERWDTLDRQDRVGVCEHLRDILIDLRKLRQDPSDPFLGMYDHSC